MGRFLARTAVVAIAMFVLGFVGHQLILGRDYVSIEPIMRDKADMLAHMPFAVISSLTFSAAFVWIYSQVRGDGAWLLQGLRFGLAIWAVAEVPLYLTNYTIEPWPGVFVVKILIWELAAALILGMLVAGLTSRDARLKGRSSGVELK